MSLIEPVGRADAGHACDTMIRVPPIEPDRDRGETREASRLWARWTFPLCILALVAMTAAAFARWQIAGAVVPWDSKNHFYPMFRFLGHALRHGTIPLWNPYHFAGYPAVADPQSLLFTPSMVLFALIAPDASMQVFDAVVFAHLVAGAIGMLGLARRWRWHPLAALLCAMVFAFGGTAASRLQHTGMIISYAWFPLALWSLLATLDAPGRGLRVMARAGLAGVLAALMALGRDQVAYLLCLTLMAAVGCEAAGMPQPLAFLRSRTPRLLVAAAVTLACTLVPILLTLQFLGDSNRPGIPFGMALEGSLDPVNLLTLIAPDVFGSLDRVYDYWGPGAATMAGNDWTDRTIDYLFVGTLPLVLLVWHGMAGAQLLERGARAFTLLLVAALIYALGRNTILFSLIFDWLPGVSLYRRPADATFLMTIALAFLAGHLLHRYIAAGLPRPRPRVAWTSALGTTIAAIALAGFGLSFAHEAGQATTSLVALAVSATLALAVAALMASARGAGRTRVAAILVAATAAQLLWRNCASPLNAEPASAYSAYAGLYPDEAGGLAVLRRDLAARAAEGEHPRVEILGLNGSWQNAAMVFEIEDTLGYNPLRIADYERAVGVGESANDPKLRSFPDTFRGYTSRLAGLLGLEYLLIDRPLDELPRHVPRPNATLLYSSEDVFLYRLQPPPAPRVYVASQVVPIDDAAVLAAGALPAFDLPRQALLDRADQGRLTQPALLAPRDPDPTSHATMTAHDDNRVVVDVASNGGLLVLHDIAYPGWTARVDGTPKPVLRANLIFRGVEVTPGHHTVEFAYHPFAMSNLVSAVGRLLQGHRS